MSCLFDSLQIVLSTKNLRNQVCDYLTTNPIIFDNLCAMDLVQLTNGITLEGYISSMRHPETWGGGLELKCVSNIFKIRILVKTRTATIEILPKDAPVRTVTIAYLDEHYFVPRTISNGK